MIDSTPSVKILLFSLNQKISNTHSNQITMATSEDSDNRVPMLKNWEDDKKWTIRLKHHICSIETDHWKSIEKAPHIPINVASPDTTPENPYTIDSPKPYPEDNLIGEDLRKVHKDSKAYSLMCKGLPLQVLARLEPYQTCYTMYKALKVIFEGGEQIRNVRKQKLKRQLQLFELMSGKTFH